MRHYRDPDRDEDALQQERQRARVSSPKPRDLVAMLRDIQRANRDLAERQGHGISIELILEAIVDATHALEVLKHVAELQPGTCPVVLEALRSQARTLLGAVASPSPSNGDHAL